MLRDYGLDEEILTSSFNDFCNGKEKLVWSLEGVVPTYKFYHILHQYLKKWPVTRSATKRNVGRFYLAIDHRLRYEGVRPDKIYRFIENISKNTEDVPVMYQKDKLISCSSTLEKSAAEMKDIESELAALKEELIDSRKQLRSVKVALKDVTNQAELFKKQRDCAHQKAREYKSKQQLLLEELADIQEDYCDLSKEVAAIEQELRTDLLGKKSHDETFTIETKEGRRYSPTIRKLYYNLLAKEVPASRVNDIIKTIVKCLIPSVSIGQLKLPKKACVSYMRKDELQIVSAAHKATVLCEHAASGVPFRLNTDGTTKDLKKVFGVGINDMVISVNELPDGTATTAIADVTRELEKLRRIANDLKIPNANSINWIIFTATSSDSAASQRKFNRLIEDCRINDEAVFGSANSATVDIIESFCSMHLAVNLRKVFLNGMLEESAFSSNDRYHPLDTFVHEFCKVFGCHGVPEYSCGVAFKDFLSVRVDESDESYYSDCATITMERQVGSRYFVTAVNALKIVYLREAAIEFLEYTGKNEGTKLEKEVYLKLTNDVQVLFARADALMFYHIYANLVELSKSNDLNKSVLDMNLHYLELKVFLELVENDPSILLQRTVIVFTSEEKLYNRHIPSKSLKMHKKLFKECSSSLFPLLKSGVIKMKEKLCLYAQSNLPGGVYWEPSDPQIKEILSQMKPSNDFCESLLGLNDYLSTALPNLHQVAKSNLIELKKNKSLKWFDDLPDNQQLSIIDLAIEKREAVKLDSKQRSEQIMSQRKEKMIKNHQRQEEIKRKMKIEQNKLSQIHLITSSKELQEAVKVIESREITATKKKQEMRSLLSNQIKIRKKLLKQDIDIKFSNSRRERPLSEVILELSCYIDEHIDDLPPFLSDPYMLVGRRISHKFETEEGTEVQWYNGIVLDYDTCSKTHTVVYDGEEDQYCFDLTMDIVNGDLTVVL